MKIDHIMAEKEDEKMTDNELLIAISNLTTTEYNRILLHIYL